MRGVIMGEDRRNGFGAAGLAGVVTGVVLLGRELWLDSRSAATSREYGPGDEWRAADDRFGALASMVVSTSTVGIVSVC